jgi:RNA polymerase sigma-70 factor (ECF subfamily)
MLENAPTAAAQAVADRGRLDVAALVRTHHAELYRYAYRLTGSVQDAEDLTQQVFLIAQARGDQLRDASHAGSWLFTILRNTFLKTTRRKTPLPAGSLAIDLEGVPDKVTSDDIDREQLQAALDELPDEFRIVVLMFYFEGCSYREIAKRLDIADGTVMSRLSRAKSHLRRRLFRPEPRKP